MDYELLKKIYGIGSFSGYSDDEISEMLEGFETAPSALTGFWKKCGNTKELFGHSNDNWIDLEFRRKYMWVKEQKDYYYLLNENQGVYQAAIRREDMSLPDPPVYVVETSRDNEVKEVGKAEESVSAFLMGMLLYEASLGLEFDCGDFIWYSEDDIAQIDALLQKYPYHVYNWYSERIDVYGMNDEALLFILQGDDPQGTYSARSEDALQKMDELIGEIGER